MWKELEQYVEPVINPDLKAYQLLLEIFESHYGKMVSTVMLQDKIFKTLNNLVSTMSRFRGYVKTVRPGYQIYTIMDHNAYVYHKSKKNGKLKLLEYYPELKQKIKPVHDLMDYAMTTNRKNAYNIPFVVNLPFRDNELISLGLLALHVGEVVSYDDLILECWGEKALLFSQQNAQERDFLVASLRSTFSRARRAIESKFEDRYQINNEPNVGYALHVAV